MKIAASDIDYRDLFTRWERAPWSATEIDFSEDARQWNHEMSDTQRRSALWHYGMFMHGENAVAESLAPFIDAAPTPDQKYFLATQQADEARHAVMFARFMHEVVGLDADVVGALAQTESQLTWGFRQIFGRLEAISQNLARNPSLPELARAIALYHLIVEATLAQPGQRIVEAHLAETGLLPGLLSGMRMVEQDEQRHIAFGVKMLADLTQADERCKETVIELFREAIPWVTAALVPPDWDEEYVQVFGYSLEDVYELGMKSFEGRLRAAGLPPEELHGAVPWPMDLTARQRAERALALLRGGMIGTKTRTPTRDEAVVHLLFDTVRLAIDDRKLPPRAVTMQWLFSDFDPWHVSIDNGSGYAAQGRAKRPDIIFKAKFDDWVDLFAGRVDPRQMMLRRKFRVRSNLKTMRYLPKLFA